MEINYWQIVKEAFWISWRKKHFWVLAVFGVLFQLTIICASVSLFGWEQKAIGNNFGFFCQNQSTFFLSVILVIILAPLSFFGRAGLVFGLNREISGQKNSLKRVLKKSRGFFWPLAGVSFLTGFSIFVIPVALFSPVALLFFGRAYFLSLVLGLVACFIASFLLVLVFFLRIYGRIYLVLGKISLFLSLENAYRLFMKNFSSSLQMAVWVWVGSFFCWLLAGLVFSLGVLFFSFLILALPYGLGNERGLMTFAASLWASSLFFLIRSFGVVFSQAVWILFFRQIAKSEETEMVALEEEFSDKFPVSSAVKAFRE